MVTLYLVALHVAVIFLVGERFAGKYVGFFDIGITAVADPSEKTESPSPVPIPSVFAEDLSPQTSSTPTPTVTQTRDDGRLMIPVQGVRPEQLVDSFTDARSSGRVHDAIDIMAPAGTPVLAAVDGEIVNFFDSIAGGITIYQMSTDRRFIYYYAHLQRRAEDVKVGDLVRQGKVIGFVGDTGNAGAGNNHLHFSIAQAVDPKRFWEGTYLNPFTYLKSGRAPEIK